MTRAPAEEDPQPPLDLRLVPMAMAVWGGALLALAVAAHPSWWPVAGVLVTGSGLLGVRRRWRWGALVATAGFIAALVITGLRWHAAAQDPLTVAAGRGSWTDVDMTVRAAPRTVADTFPATDAGGGPTAAAQRWLLTGSVDRAQIADRTLSPATGLTVLATGPAWGDLIPGQQIRLRGLLGADHYSVLPGAMVNARGDPQITGPAPWWQRGAATIRRQLVISAAGLAPDARGLLPGLVVGDTDGISDQLAADAKITGLTHLLAVSGSHFALLCGLAVLLLRRAGPRIAAAGGGVVLIALVVLVGPSASVLRAAVMGTIALVAMSVGRGRTALPALATAVIGLLLYDPTLAVSVGFALSVQATAGLVLLAPVWSKALQQRGFPSGWADLLAVPAAAHVATMPVIAALSGAVSLAAIPANLLAAAAVGPALVIGVLCAVLGPWWPGGAAGLARVDQIPLEWIAGVAHRLARWQSATVPWPASVSGVLALTGLLLAALLALRHQRIRALLIAIAIGAGLILIPAQVISVGWPPPGWVLTGCEVGQGDAMVLSTGEPGTAVVVDAGPDPALIDACLTRLQIGTVPLVVLTHLHADHVDGLAGVLAGRSVGAIGVGPDRDAPAAWRTVTELAASRSIPVVALPKGARWRSGDLSFEVLGPVAAFHGTDSDENNDSVVLMARTNGVRILMTGDVQNEAQQQLLDQGVDLRAEVLEQPHHGSAKILPAFVAAVAPRISVIGVGLGNDYGQPNPRALAQLAAIGATVLRTDTDGDAVVAVVDGRLSVVTRGARLPAAAGAAGSGDGQ